MSLPHMQTINQHFSKNIFVRKKKKGKERKEEKTKEKEKRKNCSAMRMYHKGRP